MLQFPEHKPAPPVAGRDSIPMDRTRRAPVSRQVLHRLQLRIHPQLLDTKEKARAKTKDLERFLLMRPNQTPLLKK